MESVWFLFWCCLWEPLLSVDCFHKLCLSGTPTENSQGGWDLGNRVARGYRFNARWVCPLGSTAWGIQVLEHQCSYQCLSSFSMQEQTFFASSWCTALRWWSHNSHHYLQKSMAQRSPPLPIAHHTVTFSWLNSCWVCLWGCWDAQNRMFCLLTCPLKWKWASSLNRIKPRSPGLFSILSLTVWQNLLLSSLLASVYFWRICALYGNNFKSLWMILCIAVLEMLTSWDSRRVDFHGDCSRCFLSAWALARVLTATYHPLWLLLSFPTLPVFLNFSTIFVILFLHGGFLSGNSLWNSHWVMTTDFVEE